MNIPIGLRKSRALAVLAFTFAQAAAARTKGLSQSAATALDQLPDDIGASLQRTMIWAPPDAKLESQFVAFRPARPCA
jgi:hypothetical protein